MFVYFTVDTIHMHSGYFMPIIVCYNNHGNSLFCYDIIQSWDYKSNECWLLLASKKDLREMDSGEKD